MAALPAVLFGCLYPCPSGGILPTKMYCYLTALPASLPLPLRRDITNQDVLLCGGPYGRSHGFSLPSPFRRDIKNQNVSLCGSPSGRSLRFSLPLLFRRDITNRDWSTVIDFLWSVLGRWGLACSRSGWNGVEVDFGVVNYRSGVRTRLTNELTRSNKILLRTKRAT